ncbi:MAG: hypothetical protein KOO60_04785 [Gemmatimonadales bacterium]|nr:hypothetical protein [Gemmatimonadales bacterium]
MRLICTTAAVGILARLFIIWTGWAEGGLIADDAYYYFKIASNMAAGDGSTFDGLAPTNGYHPLWLWVLVPVFQIFGGSLWLPVKLALTLSTLFDLTTGVLLLLILRNLGYERGAWVAILFWFLSPFTLLLGLRGMEASLSAMLVMSVFWHLSVLVGKSQNPGVREGLLTSLLLGLAGLARIDNLAVLGLALVLFAVILPQASPLIRREATMRWLGVVAFGSVVVVLPWFWWNLTTFDSLIPVSGLVKNEFDIYGRIEFDWHSIKSVARSLTNATVGPIFHAARFASLEEFSSARLTHLATLGMTAGVLVTLYRSRKELLQDLLLKPAGALLLAGSAFMAGHVVLMSVIWRAYINWYALPYLSLYALLLGVLCSGMMRSSKTRRMIPVSLLTLVSVFCLILYGRFFTGIELGPALGEHHNRTRFEALANAYPQGVCAGAFNAGLLGYAASGFGNITVINLDCRVNNVAFAAAKEGRLSQYIIEHVDVLLEPPGSGYFLFQPGELQELESSYTAWPDRLLWSRDQM